MGDNFVVGDDMQDGDFRTMLTKAFPHLERHREASSFIADLSKIGGFMTRRQSVMDALDKLDKHLRKKIAADTQAMADVRDGVGAYMTAAPGKFTPQMNARREPVIFKTHKLLSNALRHYEAKQLFNSEGAQPPSPDDPGFGFAKARAGSNAQNLAQASKWEDVGVRAAPKGVPVMVGTVAAAWNSVILRQGYQVKDPGAGVNHGEYTHRLQWNAIFHSGLKLDHRPVDIYKALGASWVRHPVDQVYRRSKLDNQLKWLPPEGGGQGYYIWQMIFDAGENKGTVNANSKGTAGQDALKKWSPRSSNFTCPEVFNRALGGSAMRPNPAEDLFALKILNHVRFQKRGIPEGKTGVPHDPMSRFGGATRKRMTHVVGDPTGETVGLIVWYVTE